MLHVFYEEAIGWLHLDDEIPYYAKLKTDGAALGPDERAKLMSAKSADGGAQRGGS